MQRQKQEVRKLMKNVLKSLSSSEKERQSSIIQNYLLNNCQYFKNAKHIGVYISQNEQEIDTTAIIRTILTAYKTTKSVYVPHVDFKLSGVASSEMKFYEIKSLDQYDNQMTCNNKYKLKQFDTTENLDEVSPSLLDLIIVPAMAFSIESNTSDAYSRLGRGKGYYDRYLSRAANCYTIGLAFNQQLIPNDLVGQKVPFDENYDRYLNRVLCEKLIIRRKSG